MDAFLRRAAARQPRGTVRLTVLFLCGSSVLGCDGAEPLEGAGASATPVRVRAVTRLDRPMSAAFSGEVEALRSANVGFLVPGLVASVGPQEGDRVARGDVLAELDPLDYELNVEMAAAQLQLAEDEHRRAQAVFEQRGIPETDLQKAQTAVRIASVQERMASKRLADARVEAPMDGVVARRGIEPGEQAGPGLPIFTIVTIDPVYVRVGVPEAEIGRISIGQRADVTIPALGGHQFEGRVRLVGIAADPQSRTYNVKIEVSNSDHRLRPGMIAEVGVELDDRVSALTVPGEAIVRDGDGITRVFVYFADEQRVHARRVEVGSAHGTEIEIREGLVGDEMIVVGGQHRLREGSLVEVVTGDPGAAGDSDAADGGASR